MARWRWVEPPHIEAPEWYRVFHAEAWDEPDGQELAMTGGVNLAGTDGELHQYHAQRRWHEAQHEYRRTHPALAEQEFAEIVNSYNYRRQQEERRW